MGGLGNFEAPVMDTVPWEQLPGYPEPEPVVENKWQMPELGEMNLDPREVELRRQIGEQLQGQLGSMELMAVEDPRTGQMRWEWKPVEQVATRSAGVYSTPGEYEQYKSAYEAQDVARQERVSGLLEMLGYSPEQLEQLGQTQPGQAQPKPPQSIPVPGQPQYPGYDDAWWGKYGTAYTQAEKPGGMRGFGRGLAMIKMTPEQRTAQREADKAKAYGMFMERGGLYGTHPQNILYYQQGKPGTQGYQPYYGGGPGGYDVGAGLGAAQAGMEAGLHGGAYGGAFGPETGWGGESGEQE